MCELESYFPTVAHNHKKNGTTRSDWVSPTDYLSIYRAASRFRTARRSWPDSIRRLIVLSWKMLGKKRGICVLDHTFIIDKDPTFLHTVTNLANRISPVRHASFFSKEVFIVIKSRKPLEADWFTRSRRSSCGQSFSAASIGSVESFSSRSLLDRQRNFSSPSLIHHGITIHKAPFHSFRVLRSVTSSKTCRRSSEQLSCARTRGVNTEGTKHIAVCCNPRLSSMTRHKCDSLRSWDVSRHAVYLYESPIVPQKKKRNETPLEDTESIRQRTDNQPVPTTDGNGCRNSFPNIVCIDKPGSSLPIVSQPICQRVRIHGVTRFGSRGNMDVLRILSRPRKSMTTRSMPMPPPACGGQP